MRMYGFTQYGGPEVQEFLDVPDVESREKSVLIKTKAVGINPADIKVRSGKRTGSIPVDFPMAMCREAAGVVIAADPESGLVPGDKVFGSTATGTGALAEKVLLNAAQTAKIPDGVSFEQAACIPVAIGTAWDALQELQLEPSQTLLVLGAGGGVGSHALQLAKHLGVRVIGVASHAKKVLVEGYGAQHLDSAQFQDVGVNEETEVDAVLDCVGGETLRLGAALVADKAKIRSVAATELAKELGGSGVTRRRTTNVFAEVAELIRSGAVAPNVSGVVVFEKAASAVAELESGHALGKTVVVFAD
jgi:NADPH:quinone reductase-like Zn-dependent oxidoreductase